MSTDVAVVIQARMGSSRLPGKVLADVDGRPMLEFQLDRLRELEVDVIAVATSDLSQDDVVADLVRANGVEVVRGSETDVLDRYGLALQTFDPAHVVRLTGDCPLSDPALVEAVIRLHIESGAAYTSNVHPRTFPKGLDVEVVAAPVLAVAVAEAVESGDREHVTPFVHRQPERFARQNLAHSEDLSELWWTVDTAEDVNRVRQMVALVDEPVHAPWTDYLAAVRRWSID
jgi:spore coat polysaccharide biosynthesis protein SpsF